MVYPTLLSLGKSGLANFGFKDFVQFPIFHVHVFAIFVYNYPVEMRLLLMFKLFQITCSQMGFKGGKYVRGMKQNSYRNSEGLLVIRVSEKF